MTDYREKFYQKYISEQTSKLFSFSEKEYSYYNRVLALNYLSFMPQSRSARALELGCGPGFFLRFLEAHGFQDITGIDISPEQVVLAREKTGANVLEGNITDFLDSTEERFDVVVMRHVLEHFNKKECVDIMEKIHHVLNENGIVIIEVPNAGSPIFGALSHHIDFTHEVGFTAQSLARLVQVGGFDVAHSGPMLVLPLIKRFVFFSLNRISRIVSAKTIHFDTSIFCVGRKKSPLNES